ncbi:accessory secretory protein Asp2 [Streptococcus sp. GMD2S]|nr:accessory secretory protein Asp2 [Streptococcus sp. GMD2S]
MEKKYKILQIGPEDWRDTLALPAQLDWYHVSPDTPSAIQKIMDENDLEHFHAVILADGAYLGDLLPFSISSKLNVLALSFKKSSFRAAFPCTN